MVVGKCVNGGGGTSNLMCDAVAGAASCKVVVGFGWDPSAMQ